MEGTMDKGRIRGDLEIREVGHKLSYPKGVGCLSEVPVPYHCPKGNFSFPVTVEVRLWVIRIILASIPTRQSQRFPGGLLPPPKPITETS